MARHHRYSKLCGFYLCLCLLYAYVAPTRRRGQAYLPARCAIMARLPRFERGTCRLGGGCSILLSYRREGAGADSTIYCGRAHQPRRHSITPRERAPAALVTPYLPHFLSGPSNAILSTSVNAGKTRAWPETHSLKSHLTCS